MQPWTTTSHHSSSGNTCSPASSRYCGMQNTSEDGSPIGLEQSVSRRPQETPSFCGALLHKLQQATDSLCYHSTFQFIFVLPEQKFQIMVTDYIPGRPIKVCMNEKDNCLYSSIHERKFLDDRPGTISEAHSSHFKRMIKIPHPVTIARFQALYGDWKEIFLSNQCHWSTWITFAFPKVNPNMKSPAAPQQLWSFVCDEI